MLSFIVILAILGGCTSQEADKSPSPSPSTSETPGYVFETDPEVLGPDLEAYLNSLGNLGVLENEVVGLFDAVSGTNFKGNAQLLKQLELIIPKANTFLSKLKQLEIRHPEIENFHNEYVSIWTEQVSAFEGMKAAIEADDQSALETEANRITSARRGISPLQNQLKALTAYAGIEIVF